MTVKCIFPPVKLNIASTSQIIYCLLILFYGNDKHFGQKNTIAKANFF